MKLKDLWKLSLDNEWKMGLRSFFNIVLYIIGITVIGIMVYLISMDADAKKSMDKSLRKGIESFGYAYCELLSNDYTENYNLHLPEIMDDFACVDSCSNGWWQSGLSLAGDWSIEYKGTKTTSPNLELLQNVQKKNAYNPFYAVSGASLEVTYLNPGAWEMFQIDLYKGTSPADIDYENYGDATPIYLGYKYKNVVEPGTRISNGTDTYIVEGILAKKSKMPVAINDIIDMSSEDEQISIASWLLDYSILLVPEVVDEMGIDCFFTLADGYTFDDVRNALDEIYAGSTTLVYVESIEGYMDNISNNAEKKEMLELFLFVTVIICLILSCFQTNTVLSQKKEYGVLLACGLSHRDIIKMVFIDNIKKLAIAVLIMICVVAGKLTAEIKLDTMTVYMLRHSFYSRLAIVIAVVGIVLMLIVCMVPAVILRKASTVELLGGK